VKFNLSKSQIGGILADPYLSDFEIANLKDLGRSDLLGKSIQDLYKEEFETMYEEVLRVWTGYYRVIREYVAEQDKGPFPIVVRCLGGAHFVLASEYPKSESFSLLSDADRYVEKKYGVFLIGQRK
jgi:hypothetical protein